MKVAVAAVALLVASAHAALPVVSRQGSCQAAFEKCIFTFEGTSGIPVFSPGAPDTSISPVVVYKDGSAPTGEEPMASPSGEPGGVLPDIVGHIDATGEATVYPTGGAGVLISQYECPSQSFSQSFFKATNLGVNDMGYPVSGVGHEFPQADQVDCLDGLCVSLFMRKWQSFGADGSVDNILSDDADRDVNCAVFILKV
eukprot:CAMPEP_0198328574 /NCGR_PEP_ID=MMETSP1450-20131203/15557_1 /TAXON_ID=753684 ORGANISM="Madagascaria erythrocladiodes, Strain CCMP3234" /NCGR_SAMPLE_ID=MMETSP1450 /ASSEMBLY_ACC=CAM_ASM_001115 /LENGTH=198 /DNA_ID=CAMNT_0044032717 /DNA_START=95 /DNA_END=691 /DNA_ORIENTATION=-